MISNSKINRIARHDNKIRIVLYKLSDYIDKNDIGYGNTSDKRLYGKAKIFPGTFKRVIFINRKLESNQVKSLFLDTIFHELGHCLLHLNPSEAKENWNRFVSRYDREIPQELQESQADLFAVLCLNHFAIDGIVNRPGIFNIPMAKYLEVIEAFNCFINQNGKENR